MRNYEPELQRIRLALAKAAELAKSFSPQSVAVRTKGASGPVTEADLALDRLLFQSLVCDGEGWLSEETVDDLTRLGTSRVWIVDPIDGTREFLAGLPEWSVSVAFVEDGIVAAAGILNPWADQLFLGARGQGVTMNGRAVAVSQTGKMEGARVLASRSELRRGLWSQLSTSKVRGYSNRLNSLQAGLGCFRAGRGDAQPRSQARVGHSGWRGLGGVRRRDGD